MPPMEFRYRYTGERPAYLGGSVGKEVQPGEEFESPVAIFNPWCEPLSDAAQKASSDREAEAAEAARIFEETSTGTSAGLPAGQVSTTPASASGRPTAPAPEGGEPA